MQQQQFGQTTQTGNDVRDEMNSLAITNICRERPYSVRHMENAAGVHIWHIIAVDGTSIIATCYEEAEAKLLASAANKAE